MKQIFANNFSTLQLGRQGENLARQVVFDLSDWISGYGDGVAELIAQRPGDERPYPVAAVREVSTLVWPVSKSDTAVAASYGSFGHCELRWYVGDVLVKSKTWRTLVDPAMDTPSETAPPEPEQGWVEQVIEVGVEVQKATKIAGNMAIAAGNAAVAAVKAKGESEEARKGAEAARDRAETAVIKQPIPNADTGTWWVWDTEAGEYKDSAQPTGGDGVQFTTDETLSLKDGVLSVNTAQEPEPDNTLPITSAAVHTTVGNIEILLQTI